MLRRASSLATRFAQLDRTHKAALAKALYFLAWARYRHGRAHIAEILDNPGAVSNIEPAQKVELEPTKWAIAAVSRRLPWRSDCLLQAMAAARWLGTKGVDTTLHIGVRKAASGALEAHAWLTAADSTVTGDLKDLHTFVPIPLDDFARSQLNFPTA